MDSGWEGGEVGRIGALVALVLECEEMGWIMGRRTKVPREVVELIINGRGFFHRREGCQKA